MDFNNTLKLLKESDVPDHYESDEKFRKHWQDKGVDNTTIKGQGYIRPMDIRVEKKNRKQGLGTSFMEDLCKFGDHHKLPVRLSPGTDFGASSKARLVNFYKRFGFVENKGRNKYFAFRETMYREPQ
jgi:GNAT superfamily N-acetyltransferase